MRLISVCLLILFVYQSRPVQGDSLRIAAVVGDAPITMLDFQERLVFAIATSGMQDSPELRAQLSSQIMNGLIEEKLKLKEATKFKMDISDAEIEREWERIEAQNQLPKGALKELIRDLAIRESVLRDQIRADISWLRYITARYRPQIVVSDRDIELSLKKFESHKTKARFLSAEIFISFDAREKREAALTSAKDIVGQLRKGARFPALARELSQGFTAEQGGDLGWIYPEQLTKPVFNRSEKTLGDVLKNLQAKQISDPIETQDGFHILFVREKIDPLNENEKDEQYKIKQVFLPLAPDIESREKEDIKRRFEQMRRQVKTQEDIQKVQAEVGGLQPPERWVQLSEFNQDIRQALSKLSLNQLTPILELENGFTFMMLCEKRGAMDITSKHKEMMKEEMIMEKLGMYARRALRDLKQATHIDVRL